MPVTLTIKQVPDQLAERLRQRAEINRRSLQGELLLIIERAADADAGVIAAEPAHPVYHVAVEKSGKTMRHSGHAKGPTGRLSLDALWQRARKLGVPMPTESVELIRRDRDARHGR